MEEILKDRAKNQTLSENVNEFRPLNLPSLIPQSSIFSKLGNLVHSKTFVHVLLVALWETVFPLLDQAGTQVTSEMVLGEVVQLILIALHICRHENVLSETEPTSNFFYFAVNHKVATSLPSISESERETCLLDIILALVDRANELEIKEQAPRLRYIIRSFEEIGNQYIGSIVSGWRDKSKWSFFSIPSSLMNHDLQKVDEVDEKAKRKMEAKARQAAIKAQFAQAQNTFKANFGDELEDDGVGDAIEIDIESIDEAQIPDDNLCISRKAAFPSGTCIVCQEDAKSASNVYGMLCLLQESNIQRQVDVLDSENLMRVYTAPVSFDEAIIHTHFVPVTAETINDVPPESTSTFFHRDSNLNGSRIVKKGILPSSCGHLMHISCHQNFLSSIQTRQSSQPLRNHPENLQFKQFLCPLCKSLGNAIIPILWPSKTEYPCSYQSTPGSEESFDQLNSLSTAENLLRERIPNFLNGIEPHANAESISIDKNVASCMSPMYSTNETENSWLDTIAIVYERYLFMNIRKLQSPADVYFTRPELSLASALQTWDTLIYFICGLEIGCRGVSPEIGTVSEVRILGTISSVNLTLLSVLSETCISSLLLKASKNNSALKKYVNQLLESVYPSKSLENGDQSFILLHKDGFTQFARICLALFPRYGILELESIYPWITLFGFFEVVRTIVSVIEALLLHGNEWISNAESANISVPPIHEEELKFLSKLIFSICLYLDTPSILKSIDCSSKIKLVYRLCYSSLLTYTRKTILFLNGRFGIVIPKNGSVDPSEIGKRTELARNSAFLLLPSMKSLFAMIENPEFRMITDYWCKSLIQKEDAYWSSLKAEDQSHQAALMKRQRISIDQGLIYELVSMPNRLEVVFEAALKYVCNRCHSGT